MVSSNLFSFASLRLGLGLKHQRLLLSQVRKFSAGESRYSPDFRKYASNNEDFYKILGVGKDATPQQIKSAYYKLVKQYHPDQNHTKDAEEKFKKIKDAYETLRDAGKKAEYDAFTSGGSSQNYDYNANANNTNNGYQHTDFGTWFGGNDSFFDHFFGGGAGRRSQAGAVYQVGVNVSFITAIRGGKMSVPIQMDAQCSRCNGTTADPAPNSTRQCTTCHGTGYIVNKKTSSFISQAMCSSCGGAGTIILKHCTLCRGTGSVSQKFNCELIIPPGAENETVIKHKVKNNTIHFVLSVLKDRNFERSGLDLKSDVTVNWLDAVLGGKITAHTVHGPVELTIPAGTSSHSEIRVPGQGVKMMNGAMGNHYFRVKIFVPKNLTEADKSILNQLKK